MVSDLDFKNVFGEDVKIVKYNELKEYKTFNDLLPSHDSFIIVLIESEYNSGHWCCLFRTKTDDIYWMDSYGVKPDGELKFIPERMRKLLGENSNELQRLMKTIPKDKFHYFKERLQTMKDGVNTCGRWCMFFIKMCLFGFTMPEIVDFIKRKSKQHKKPSDILIIDWCPS